MNVQVTSVSKKEQKLAKTKHAEFPDSQLIDHMPDRCSIFRKITWRF